MIAALVIGTVLAVGALAFVLYPVFFGAPRPGAVATRASSRDRRDERPPSPRFARSSSIAQPGKLSDADYAELKTRYTEQAIDAMRREAHAIAGELGRPATTRSRRRFARIGRTTRRVRRAVRVRSPTPRFARTVGGTYATGAPIAAHLSRRLTRGTA